MRSDEVARVMRACRAAILREAARMRALAIVDIDEVLSTAMEIWCRRDLRRYDPTRGSVEALACARARHLVIDAIRRHKRRREIPSSIPDSIEDETTNPGFVIEERDRQARYDAAERILSHMARSSPVVAGHLAGRSGVEIAREHAVHPSTVSRAIKITRRHVRVEADRRAMPAVPSAYMTGGVRAGGAGRAVEVR